MAFAARADALTLLQPQSGANLPASSPVSFQWEAVSGATSYTLSRYTGSTCAGTATNSSTANTSLSLTLAAGGYSFKVTAYQNSTQLDVSECRAFWVDDFCVGTFLTGDFDGDGRTDRLCNDNASRTARVSLATPTGFAAPVVWLSQGASYPMAGDFNGDGRTDIAQFNSATGVFSVALSNGTGFGALTNWGMASAGGYSCVGAAGRTGDFNGDGRMDVACKPSVTAPVLVGLSNGTTFSFSVFGTALCDAGESVGTLDMDGDGKDDWYCIGIPNGLFRVFRSTGTGWLPLVSAADATFCAIGYFVIGDLNGDGRTDLACTSNGKVSLSTGNAYLYQGAFGAWCAGSTNAFAADLDGDGVSEMVCNNTGAGTNDITVRKWQGTSLGPEQTWMSSFCSGTVSASDFNGDGKTDLLCDKTRVAISGTQGVRADLLVETAGGLGGTVQVGYAPSTAFLNEPGAGLRYVTTGVTTFDGRGGTSTTGYSYSGAKMDKVERQFLGFASMRMTQPCLPGEATCPYTVTTLSQQLASPGKPLTITRYDGAGVQLAAQSFTYTNNTLLPRTSLLTRSDSYAYDSAGGSRQTYVTYGYDAYGNQTQVVSYGDISQTGDELQTDISFSYNTSAYIVGLPGQIVRKVPPNGSALQTEQYEYDSSGNWATPPVKGDRTAVKRRLIYSNPATDRYVTRSYAYNAQGAPTSVTDETNRQVTTTYDATDNLFPEVTKNPANEPETKVTTYWDHACATVQTTSDPNNQSTTTTYDALCRPQHTDLPLGGYVERSYLDLGDPNSQRTRVEATAATGVSGPDWSETYFDGLGRTYRSLKRGPSASQDIVVEQTYNDRGGLESSTEPFYQSESPRTTSYTYDALNRLVQTQLPDGHTVGTTYKATSRTTTDPNGKPVTTHFDANGRTVAVDRTFNSQIVTTTTTYDTPLGLQKGMQDPRSNAWSWVSDSLGRLRDETDPDAGHWTYDYDDAGRPTLQTDAKAQQTTLHYDPIGRIDSRTSPAGTVTYAYGERTGYSNLGRLTTVTSPADVLRMDYDALGRAVRQWRMLDGVDYIAQKTYDAGGYLVSTTYPDSDVVGPLGYDEAGRLTSITGIVTQVTYDASGRPLHKANANGLSTDWTYTPDRGFLQRIQTTSGIQDLTYDPDPVGLVRGVTSPVAGEGWTYDYDDFYHLTSATNGTSPADSQTFSYDEIDRMNYNSRVGTYTYPQAPQPRPHAPASVNGSQYTYDANGNLFSGGGRTPVWDAENRIAQIGTTQFTYDGVGERLKKTSPGGTSLFPFGDDYEITNGTITKYVSVDGLGVIAKRVGTGPGAQTYWLHTDRLGSIQAITDATGTPVFRRTYRPYGETLGQSGSQTESRGWIDQRNDGETGLTYLHARYSDPQLGVFLSADRSDPGLPGVGLNRYAYGLDDPVNGMDRSGLSGCQTWSWTSTFPGFPTQSGSGSSGDCPPTSSGLPYDRITLYTGGASHSILPFLLAQCLPPYCTPPSSRGPDIKKPEPIPIVVVDITPPEKPTPTHPTPRTPNSGNSSNEPNNFSYHDVEQRLAAFWDGVIPFADPFSDLYQDCWECAASATVGEVTRDTELLLASSASGALFGRGTWLNRGFYRIGHSPHEGWVRFSVRAGREHLDLWRLWRR